jgi:ATP/maltotriose-dependent transcriptional regulator MalT
LIWVTAPPGAGKSSLAATWLHSDDAPAPPKHAVWYRIDDTDADPVSFFQHLKRSLGQVPDAPVDLLEDPEPGALSNPEELAARWFETLLGTEVRAPYTFVFDDVHRLPSDTATWGILGILAGSLQASDRALCLSRQDPPEVIVSALPRSRLLRITDLTVDPGEFEDFARDSVAFRGLSREAFAARLRQSGHWISDLSAASFDHSSLRPGLTRFPSQFSYLLGTYGAEGHEALLTTAFLQVGDDADWQILGGAKAVAILTELAPEGRAVTRLPNGTLRKHDLLHEWLRTAAASQLPSDALQQARLRAGRVLASRAELMSAVRLMLEAQAPHEALSLVLEHASRLNAAGHNRELLELLALLPETMGQEPILRLWHASGRLPFRPPAAREAFRQLWRSLDPEAEPFVYGAAVFGEVRAAIEDWSIDRRLLDLVEETAPVCDRLGALPEGSRQLILLARRLALLMGDPTHPEASEAESELQALVPSLSPDLQFSIESILAHYCLWWRGDLVAARGHVTAVESLLDRSDVPPVTKLLWYYAAVGLAFWDGDDDTLRRLGEEARAFGGKWGLTDRMAILPWIEAQAFAAHGDQAAAVAALHSYEQFRRGWRCTDHLSSLHHLRAAVALSAGDTDTAVSEATQACACAREIGNAQNSGIQYALLAMARAARGERDVPTLAALRTLAEQARSPAFHLQADLAEVALAHADGRVEDFVQGWERLGQSAGGLGLRRWSGMNRAVLGTLANAALHRGGDARVTRALVALWRLTPPADDHVHEDWPYPIQIRCLGGFVIDHDGNPVRASAGKAQRKPLELLWLLVAGDGRGLAQDFVADQLWPDLDGDRAMHTLRTTLYRLRKLVGPDAVVQENDHIQLNVAVVGTDLAALRAALARLRHPRLAPAARLAAFDQALRLYRGPLLPGIDLDYVAEERQRLAETIFNKALAFLMTLDPVDPATVLRVHRLRAVAPTASLPEALARLWPGMT